MKRGVKHQNAPYLSAVMARNFGHARAVNIQTWENLKQYGYTKL